MTSNGSTCRATSDVSGGGTATLSRQDLPDGRADQPEEVRRLRPTCGDSAVPLVSLARSALPPHALLTTRVALVWQGKEPQLHHGVGLRHALQRRPAGARSSSTTRRCRGERRQRSAAAVAHARLAFCVLAHGAPIGCGGLNLSDWAARNVVLLAGLGRGDDAGWVGGAVRAEGEQCPLLWSAQSSSAFGRFCWIQRVGTLKNCTFPRAVVHVKVGPIVLVTFL